MSRPYVSSTLLPVAQALELAVTIPVDHLRGRDLLLANYSRRL